MQTKVKNRVLPFQQLTKREFLKFCSLGLGASLLPPVFLSHETAQSQVRQKGLTRLKLSPFFKALGGGEIQCELCPKGCRVPKGERGACRVRENRDGKYYSLVYGNPCSIHLDPVEKKPFSHVLPGTNSLSIATAGCNFHCKFCQNWEISQASPEETNNYDAPPEWIVKKAKEVSARSIAYTYVEPTVFYEYMVDVSAVARKESLLNVIHSNGYINRAPLQNLCKTLDAANIDLKGFTDSFYRELCDGEIEPVLEALKLMKRERVHLELTNLVIPTKNDSMDEIKEMCLWVKKELGSDTPLHFSRFYPLYQLTKIPPTPVATLEKARATALSVGIEYVYIGNVPGHEAWNTFCSSCKKMIIQRVGYTVKEMAMSGGKCRYCGNPIPGIWA